MDTAIVKIFNSARLILAHDVCGAMTLDVIQSNRTSVCVAVRKMNATYFSIRLCACVASATNIGVVGIIHHVIWTLHSMT
jgi:hypothetical protein